MIESGSLTWKTASIHINVVAPINAAVIPRLILPAQPESLDPFGPVAGTASLTHLQALV